MSSPTRPIALAGHGRAGHESLAQTFLELTRYGFCSGDEKPLARAKVTPRVGVPGVCGCGQLQRCGGGFLCIMKKTGLDVQVDCHSAAVRVVW